MTDAGGDYDPEAVKADDLHHEIASHTLLYVFEGSRGIRRGSKNGGSRKFLTIYPDFTRHGAPKIQRRARLFKPELPVWNSAVHRRKCHQHPQHQ